MDSYESTPPRRETKRISSRWRNPYDVCCREGSMKGNPKPVLQMLSMLRRIVAGLMSRDRFNIRLGVQNENLNLFERRLFNSTSSDETVKWKSLAGCVMSFRSRVMCLTVNRCALQVHWKRCVNCNWVERSLGGPLDEPLYHNHWNCFDCCNSSPSVRATWPHSNCKHPIRWFYWFLFREATNRIERVISRTQFRLVAAIFAINICCITICWSKMVLDYLLIVFSPEDLQRLLAEHVCFISEKVKN